MDPTNNTNDARQSEPGNEPNGAAGVDQSSGGAPPEGGPGGSAENELPDWVRKELSKVRNEAASYRTRLREAEAKLAEAKTADEFQAALEEMRQKNRELERSVIRANVARKYNLPDDLAEVLKGDAEEELEAHAKRLQRYVVEPSPPPDLNSLRGGLDPSDEGDFDPVQVARRVRASRY